MKTMIFYPKFKDYYNKDVWQECSSTDEITNCCGARAVNLDTKNPVLSLKRRKGLSIAVGKICEPSDNGSLAVDVVETSNGPLTIASRYVW